MGGLVFCEPLNDGVEIDFDRENTDATSFMLLKKAIRFTTGVFKSPIDLAVAAPACWEKPFKDECGH
jgi:hypothetical protein